MAASQNNSENQGDLSEIKRKLIRRVGVAALMIVGLLGGLALFDHLGSQTEDDAAEHVAEVQPAPRKTPTQPVTPAEIPPAPVEVEEKPPVPEASAAPVDKAAPPMDLPARPEVSAQPKLPKPPSGVAVPVAGAKPTETRSLPQAATAVSGAVRSEPVPAPAPVTAPPRQTSGFALQAGVFSDPRRAEELYARLTLEGIPASIESRVQVGPFKSKEEAERARARMKGLGVEAVLLLPNKAARR